MSIWQADFYYHLTTANLEKNWQLVVCECNSLSNKQLDNQIYIIPCSSEQANSQWLTQQLKSLIDTKGQPPSKIQVFRPQSRGLISTAAENLDIKVEATRNVAALKQVLKDKFSNNPNYNPITLEKPPPQALPENLWGDEWQIANIAAGQIVELFSDRPIPISRIPEALHPINLNLASDILIPGIVVYGGKQSMQLARWIEQQNPAFISYVPTEIGRSGGFILETGLVERWVFNTFESKSAAEIAKKYNQKQQVSQGLHFLWIQPDDSGMTTTAFWLLQKQ